MTNGADCGWSTAGGGGGGCPHSLLQEYQQAMWAAWVRFLAAHLSPQSSA